MSSGKGPIEWMAKNPVASNLLMGVLVIGGLLSALNMRREVFPEVSLDQVVVWVNYPGTTPGQVEQTVAIPVEQALLGLDVVSEVSVSVEAGWTWISAELVGGQDPSDALEEIKTAVDRITTLPSGMERPRIFLARNREPVMSLVLHGNTDFRSIRRAGEQVRDDLLSLPEISMVELKGLPESRIHIDVDETALERHGLDIQAIARAVETAAVQIPGGRLDAASGQLLLQIDKRRDVAAQFENIPVMSSRDGQVVRLIDVARISDTVEDASWGTFYDGEPSARIDIFRVGKERPLEISRVVKEYRLRQRLPEGLELSIWDDNSEAYESRMGLLFRNAAFGLTLMLLLLGSFLAPGLGFWVTLGIPVSFLGAMIFLPAVGVSLNMISLFGFIVALGIVVDDAIVVGEAVHKHRRDGLSRMDAAIAGAKEVAQPVTFSVITTVIAFVPIAFVSGTYGKFFAAIPLVVIPTLMISLVESLFVLPAHLSEPARRWSFMGRLERFQERFSHGLEWFVEHVYGRRLLEGALRNWTWPIAASLSALLVTYAVFEGGHLRFNFFPKIERDVAVAGIQFPVGTPSQETVRTMRRIIQAGHDVAAEVGEASLVRGVLARQGHGYKVKGGGSQWGSHVGSVLFHLTEMGTRPISTTEFSKRWRERVGRIPGAESLTFSYSSGFGSESGIVIDLSHQDPETLAAAATHLAERLRRVDGVVDVDDGYSRGKGQLDFVLTPAAEAAGLTYADLARQIRNGFYGFEVLRQIQGQSEVKVFVRRGDEQRQSEHDLETMMLTTPAGGTMRLSDAAVIEREAAPTRIVRRNGRRIVNVKADVNEEVVTEDQVQQSLQERWLPELTARFPGVKSDLGRSQEDKERALSDLQVGGLLSLLAMFALLAVASKSYLQPILVVVAIPFGMVGAVVGHLLLGVDLSLVSVLGMVALAGVVVNDSLVLVAAINGLRAQGYSVEEAVRLGARRRFRPVVLTSLTTFFGLLPMIFETSVQARFLSPMAVSLGFGVLLVTVFALLVVPVLYVGLDRLRGASWRWPGRLSPAQGEAGTTKLDLPG
ncbi:MAG: efflux RND transporter permease subunit [Myxococcota bacterium]